MLEVYGNIWDYKAQIVVLTTNGDTNRQGKAVMGRGVALEAAQRYPALPYELARQLTFGNRAYSLGHFGPNGNTVWLMTLPVKHHWHEKADVELIDTSLHQLNQLCANVDGPIVIPRPGCGNGQLSWEQVKPFCEFLDDRFHVITFN